MTRREFAFAAMAAPVVAQPAEDRFIMKKFFEV
jgi:hypothetical protein